MEKKNIEKIVLFTSFEFVHWDNAVNTTMALAQSGFFTNIIKASGVYTVNVYKRA